MVPKELELAHFSPSFLHWTTAPENAISVTLRPYSSHLLLHTGLSKRRTLMDHTVMFVGGGKAQDQAHRSSGDHGRPHLASLNVSWGQANSVPETRHQDHTPGEPRPGAAQMQPSPSTGHLRKPLQGWGPALKRPVPNFCKFLTLNSRKQKVLAKLLNMIPNPKE